MKKIKSIYVREIGSIRNTKVIDSIKIYRKDYTGEERMGWWNDEKGDFFTESTYGENPITYNSKTNTYHRGNTEYKGEHIISVTYE